MQPNLADKLWRVDNLHVIKTEDMRQVSLQLNRAQRDFLGHEEAVGDASKIVVVWRMGEDESSSKTLIAPAEE